MLMAVLEGRAPNRRTHHAGEVGVTPCGQLRSWSAPAAVGGPRGLFFYVHTIAVAHVCQEQEKPSRIRVKWAFS